MGCKTPATVAGFVLHEVAFVSTGGNRAVWKLSVWNFVHVFENGETTKWKDPIILQWQEHVTSPPCFMVFSQDIVGESRGKSSVEFLCAVMFYQRYP